MALNSNSLAAALGVGVKNQQFQPTAEVLPRKILLIGHYDSAAKTDIEPEKLYQVFSPTDVGDRFGFGFNLHRLSIWSYLGSDGVETWVLPIEPGGEDTSATGTITITATSVSSGNIYLYIAGELVIIPVSQSQSSASIANAIAAAISADTSLPLTASNASNVVNLSATQYRSDYGNDISVTFNWGFGQEFPTGLTAVVVPMSGGSGGIITPDILNALGTDDERNEKYFTDLIHDRPFDDTSSLNYLSVWNGEGNDFVGNYNKIAQRPLRSLTGDVTAGTVGLNALITQADNRRNDRTNGVVVVPGSPNHPSEIAALTTGLMAKINNDNAAESYVDLVLSEVISGVAADRWTSNYDTRDSAVKNGISPTRVNNGAVYLQNVMTYYRPTGVAPSSNGYRSQRNISVLQNITNSLRDNFDQEKWKRISIVEDVTKVTNAVARQKVKDVIAVQNDVIALAKRWESLGWIFSASYTIDEMKKGTYVQIRPGGTGFNINIPIVLSGESWVLDNTVLFDTALTVFTQ